MTDVIQQLQAAAAKATQASAQADTWANGPEGVFVDTDSGPVPTIAEFTRTAAARVEDTVAGLAQSTLELQRRSYAEAGYNLVDGSFEAGGTLVNANDVLLQDLTGKTFSGPAGTVAAGTNPTSGWFVDRSGELLRNQVVSMSYAELRAYTGTSTSIYVYGRDSVFDGVFGWFDLVPSDTTSIDDDGITLVGSDGRRWRRRFVGDVLTLWFGDVGDSTPDSTLAIQRAMDFASSIGGGRVVMGAGLRYLSMVNSVSPYSCLLIPKNVELVGAGSALTTISRLPSERGVNGILLANKNYDVFGGYNADGNITVRGFTITDGAATPTRGLGDLIAICHCDGFQAYDINGGNHDQHLFDICASKNVYIDPSCRGDNVVASKDCATIQIDGTSSLGVWGAVIDNTPTSYIKVRGKYRNTGASRAVHLFHANNIDYDNIDIDVEIDGAYTPGSSCCAIDSGCTSINVHGLKLRGKYKANHGGAIACNLFLNVADEHEIDDLDIDIETSGIARAGLYIGIDGATSGRWKTVKVTHKSRITTQSADYPSGFVYGQRLVGIDNLTLTDQCDVEISRNTGAGVIYVVACAVQACGGKSTGGRYKSGVTTSGGKYVAPFYVSRLTNSSRNLDFKVLGPILEAGSNVGHHFLGEDAVNGNNGAVTAADNVLLSAARFIGSASVSNILEPVRISDGSNGFRQVQLNGSSDAEFAIESGQLYANCKMGLKKTGAAAQLAKFELIYTPNPGHLDDDAEDIQFAYLSATTCVGTLICDINVTAGNFSILTGVSGVTMVINNTTFQPVIRSSGVIKVWCSI